MEVVYNWMVEKVYGYTVGKIICADIDLEYRGGYANIEFLDDKGNYHHYKSNFDGGSIVIDGKEYKLTAFDN